MNLDISFLEDQITARMQRAQVPGLALGILAEGELLYARGFGVTSVEDGGLSVTPETLFRIGSTTKALTATAAMRLVEAGLLALDQPVGDLARGVSFSQTSLENVITLRMLLSHTAGLPTYSEPDGRRELAGLGETLRQILPNTEFKAPPGKLASYSNLGMSLAGYLLEIVTGLPYPELMQRWLFEPLAMTRTTFDPLVALTYPLAQSHTLKPDGSLWVEHRYVENTAEYPAGSCLSTILDLAHFAQLHLNDGAYQSQRLLSSVAVTEMQRPQVRLYTLNAAAYGLGFHVDCYKGVRRVGHNGGIQGYGSRFYLAPDAGMAVIMIYNRAFQFAAHAEAIVNYIFDGLLDLPETVVPPAALPAEPARWAEYAGQYLSNFTGLVEIRHTGGQLELAWHAQDIPLERVSEDLYAGQLADGRSVSVGFIPEAQGAAQYAVVQGAACRRIEPAQFAPPAPARWDGWCGQYQGEFGDVRVTRQEAGLRLQSQERGQTVTAAPLDAARFTCAWGLLQFIETAGCVQLKIANYQPFNRVQPGLPSRLR